MTIPLDPDIARAWLTHMDTGQPLVGPVKALADAIRAQLPAEVAEPPHDAILVDREGDAWRWVDSQSGWWMFGRVGSVTWEFLQRKYGPLTIYLPQRDMVAREGHGLNLATRNLDRFVAGCACDRGKPGFRAFATTKAEAIRAVEIHAAGGMQ